MMPGMSYGPPKFKNMKIDNRKGGNSDIPVEAKKEEIVPEAIPENN
jgi:hypothetical protein